MPRRIAPHQAPRLLRGARSLSEIEMPLLSARATPNLECGIVRHVVAERQRHQFVAAQLGGLQQGKDCLRVACVRADSLVDFRSMRSASSCPSMARSSVHYLLVLPHR